MKKKILTLIISLAIIAGICTGIVIARADQENNMEVPCLHEYVVSAVHSGEITYTCTSCHESYVEDFSNHINTNDMDSLDVNGDGYINIRDYSIIYLDKNAQ